jgi:hypothetical protein
MALNDVAGRVQLMILPKLITFIQRYGDLVNEKVSQMASKSKLVLDKMQNHETEATVNGVSDRGGRLQIRAIVDSSVKVAWLSALTVIAIGTFIIVTIGVVKIYQLDPIYNF